MTRWIPVIDVVVFLAIPMLMTSLVVGSLFFEQEWPPIKIAFALGVPWSAWCIFFGFLWVRLHTRPTYSLALGTRVWTGGVDVMPHEVTNALKLYAYVVSNAHQRLDNQTLLSMLACARIEFTRSPIWWAGSKRSGIQRGYDVRVHWDGGFGENALFHELHHMVDEVLFDIAPDYKHARAPWWMLVADVKATWRKSQGMDGSL